MGFLLINPAQEIALHPEGHSMQEVAEATLIMIKSGNPVSKEASLILDQRDEALSIRVGLLLDRKISEAANFVRERSY